MRADIGLSSNAAVPPSHEQRRDAVLAEIADAETKRNHFYARQYTAERERLTAEVEAARTTAASQSAGKPAPRLRPKS